MTLLQPMVISWVVMGGLGGALLGRIRVPLARRLQIGEARVGGLVSLFGFVMSPVILMAGFLTDAAGRQPVLFGGSLVFAASLVTLGTARTYVAALAGVVLLSAGWSLLIIPGNVLTPAAFRDAGSDAAAVNLGNVFFGLGAFLTPLVLAALVRGLGLRLALVLLTAFALTPGLLTLGIDFAALEPPAKSADMESLLHNPMLWLCGLALVFYGPLEASLGAWATTYLTDHGVRETRAAGLLSAFWLAFMASRLLTALTLPPGVDTALILVLAVLCIGVLLAFVVCRRRGLAMLLVPAAGFLFGPIFPTLVAVLFRHVPASLHGRAIGLYFAIGGIGWTLIPILIGAYARRAGVQRAFRIAVLDAVGLAAVAVILLVTANPISPPPASNATGVVLK